MSNPATINDIFEAIIASLFGNNKRAFSMAIGVSPTVIENVVGKRRGKPSFDVIEKVCANANVSPLWLIAGIGEMLKREYEETPPASDDDDFDNTGVPYYDVDFVGGFGNLEASETILPERYIDVPGFERADAWCNVTGNSMSPIINAGDMIALRECSVDSIIYGGIYAIVTPETRTIKKVRKGSGANKLRLIPINVEEYDEQEYDIRRFIRVFEVMGCVSRFV